MLYRIDVKYKSAETNEDVALWNVIAANDFDDALSRTRAFCDGLEFGLGQGGLIEGGCRADQASRSRNRST